jgi:hypothetical protein
MDTRIKELREALYALNRAKGDSHRITAIRDDVAEVLKELDPTWKD